LSHIDSPHCLAYVLNRDLAYLNIWGSWSYSRSRTYMLAFTGSDDAIDASWTSIFLTAARAACKSVTSYPGHPTILYSPVVDTIMGLVCDNRDSIDNSRSE
jgi:hypothetical protein